MVTRHSTPQFPYYKYNYALCSAPINLFPINLAPATDLLLQRKTCINNLLSICIITIFCVSCIANAFSIFWYPSLCLNFACKQLLLEASSMAAKEYFHDLIGNSFYDILFNYIFVRNVLFQLRSCDWFSLYIRFILRNNMYSCRNPRIPARFHSLNRE